MSPPIVPSATFLLLLLKDSSQQATSLLSNERGPGQAALRSGSRQVNAALTEAILIGLFRRLDAGDAPDPGTVAEAVAQLHANDELQPAISQATADEEAVAHDWLSRPGSSPRSSPTVGAGPHGDSKLLRMASTRDHNLSCVDVSRSWPSLCPRRPLMFPRRYVTGSRVCW